MKSTKSTPTRLSEFISNKMEEKGLSIYDLAGKAELSYEHTRRIAGGIGAPSKYALKVVCDVLGLPFKEAEKLMMVDKIWGKYGNLLTEYMGKKPWMDTLDRVWDKLTTEQQESAISMVQGWAKTNKRKA